MRSLHTPVGELAMIHPAPERPAFVPRLGHGQQGLVELLAARGVRTTVSPLYFARHNPELSLVPAGLQMGTVLDPSTHIRQKPWAERAEGFRALSFGNDPEPYEPDRAALADDALLRLAIDPIDAARARGGTLLLTSHLAGPARTRGRDVELLLARTGIEHFRRQGMAEPPPSQRSQ